MIKIFAFCVLLVVGASMVTIQEATAAHHCPANQTWNTGCRSACPPRCHVQYACLAIICSPPACTCSPGYILKGKACVKPQDC
ncbi:venom peptide SjAPI [Nasonia vitripennis]|uniref:TIL domain-containing protein n=1 Tax=Nasonia vitripennis TaxID=7425 RepID=A0A7M7HBV2_NASVI|nr:venom peptide SjAPI [Nasonia vitripennis]